jgi:hypothetical protein
MALLDGWSPGNAPYDAAVLVIIISIILAGIAVGLGKAFQNRKIEHWGRDELLQAFINGAIVGGLIGLIAILNTAIISLVPASTGLLCPMTGNSTTAIGFAQCYLEDLGTKVFDISSLLLDVNVIVGFITSIGISFIITVNPFAGLAPIGSVIGTIIETLYLFYTALQAQYSLLYFIGGAALTTFLPIGLILRCFFATRRLGGALIAMAIGMYVVFPLTFVLDYQSVAAMNRHILDSQSALDNFKSNFSYVMGMDFGSAGAARALVGNLTAGGIYDAINGLVKALTAVQADLVVQVLILPLVGLIITAISIRELAGILGSEIGLGGFDVL